jgi:hypothetical protein
VGSDLGIQMIFEKGGSIGWRKKAWWTEIPCPSPTVIKPNR